MRVMFLLVGFLAVATSVQAATPEIRLLAGGPEPAGTVLAGLDIRLPSGAKTYWRNPGDSGIAPRFDWTGSANVAGVEVLWPAPVRFEDGGGWSIGYKDEVLLPLRVTPANPGAPVVLRLRVDYGVCEKLCLPAHGDAVLALAKSDANRARIDRALAAVPKPLPLPAPEGRQGVDEVRLEGQGADRRLMVDADLPQGSAGADLFVEGPGGWAGPRPDSAPLPGGRIRYTVPAGDLEASPDAALTFTLVGPAGASEQHWRVVPAPAK